MNKDFAGRLDRVTPPGQTQGLPGTPADTLVGDPSDEVRARRRRTQRLVLLTFSFVTLFSLVGMIITRAVEITSL